MITYDELKNNFFIMAGPNVIESEEHVFKMAKELKRICDKLKVKFIFKCSFDKANRSSINSYRGVGIKKGLAILKKVREELHIPVITDIHNISHAKLVADSVDIIQIPAFLCRQTDLLKAAAETGKIIQIKKGQFLSGEAMHQCVTKMLAFGNRQIILCERGNMYGYGDLVVDPRNLLTMRGPNNLVTMDITHCLQQPSQLQKDGSMKCGGLREFIPYMGKMAVVLGVDGIFMEVHDRPDESKCDAPTQYPLECFESYIEELINLREVC